MSGGAIIGSAVLGAGSSYMSAKKQSKAADKALASADAASALEYEVSMQNLDFAKEQYSDWENIFGPIQQNLSDFYQSRSGDSLASQGIQAIEQEYTRSRTQLDANLAKRGITNSGATAAGLTQLESSRMLGRADVSANADAQAASEQANFLNLGFGQQAQLQNNISGAYTNQMNVLGQQSANQSNLANSYSSQAAQAYAGIGNSVGQGISTYMTANQLSNPASNYYNANGTVNTAGGYYGPNNFR